MGAMKPSQFGLFVVSLLKAVVAFFVSIFYALESIVMYFVPRAFRRCDVTGKVALVTGGGSGIGRLMAQKLAKKGAKIVVWDINPAGNEETASLIRAEGGACWPYSVDLCDRKAVYAAAQQVNRDVGKVDILVNNAGVVTGRSFLEAPDELIIKTFQVNILSHFWTTKAFLPAMIAENSGHVVTVASLAGFFGVNKLVDYCASKFAAVGFDESLRLEFFAEGYTGIHTTVVCPYYINTGMFDGVQSRLLPILEQEHVAEEATDAILMRKRILVLPSVCSFLIALKGFMPHKANVKMFKAMSGVSSLKELKSEAAKAPPQAELQP